MSDWDDYQAEAMRTRGTDLAFINGSHAGLVLAALGLAGEAGEVVERVKKVVYHGKALDRYALAEELGDVLWYLALAAHEIDIPLGAIANWNVVKLRLRYPDGFSPAASEARADRLSSDDGMTDGGSDEAGATHGRR